MADEVEVEVEEVAAPAETPASTTDPRVVAEAAAADLKKLADEAKERERNATEALRVANERNREAKEERAAARAEAAEAKAAAQEAQRIARDMESGMQVLADADPESPFGRMVRGARSRGDGNGAGARNGGHDPELKSAIDGLVREVGEHRKVIAGSQYREAVASVESVATSLWNNTHKPALDGVVDEKQFVAKVRKEVLLDPVVNRPGVDEQTVKSRIEEIGREVASEINGYGERKLQKWKADRKAAKETAAPTGKESTPGAPSRERQRVKFNPNTPDGWEKYKRAHGASV